MNDKGNISGYTAEGKKAFYKATVNEWFFGSDIGRSNLVSLGDRTDEERRRFGSMGGKKAKENRDAKKTFNDLARLMLEQIAPEEEFQEILGDKKDLLLDRTYGSLILAAMMKGAKEGSFKCAEFVRDTAGYRPANKNEIDLTADIMTDADRSLIDKAYKTG
jgi:hypothetical protein